MKIAPMPQMPTLGSQGNLQPQAALPQAPSLKMKTLHTPTDEFRQVADIPNAPVLEHTKPNEARVEATQPLSPQLALLAKQKRTLQVKERELKAKERELASRSGSEMIELSRLKSEPLRVLLENGVTYDQLTQAILNNQGGNPEVHALKAELQAIKQGIDDQFKRRDTDAEKHVMAEMRREAEFLSRDDQYELVRETRSVPSVMKLIERTYRETGEVLDVTEAMRLVENELLKDMQRVTQAKKLQSQVQAQQPQLRPTGMRTLTNRDTASVPLSAKQRAIAAFYGTLKK